MDKLDKELRRSAKKFLSSTYCNITRRCSGKDPQRQNYKGLPVMSRLDFMEWAWTQEFIDLYRAYLKSGKDRKLAPSVDRINHLKGYVLDNVQWLTLSDNVKKKNSRSEPRLIFSFQISIKSS